MTSFYELWANGWPIDNYTDKAEALVELRALAAKSQTGVFVLLREDPQGSQCEMSIDMGRGTARLRGGVG